MDTWLKHRQVVKTIHRKNIKRQDVNMFASQICLGKEPIEKNTLRYGLMEFTAYNLARLRIYMLLPLSHRPTKMD